jgi:hypothetical protein
MSETLRFALFGFCAGWDFLRANRFDVPAGRSTRGRNGIAHAGFKWSLPAILVSPELGTLVRVGRSEAT